MADDGVRVGTVLLLHQTEKAIRVELEDGEEVWVPKSQVHDDSEVYGGDQQPGEEGELVVSAWFARQQGWG